MAASTMMKLLVLLAVAVAASSALPDAKVAEGGRVNHRVLPAADSDTWNTLPSEKKSSSSELKEDDDDEEEYDDDDYLDDDEEGSGDDDYYYDDEDDDDDDDWYDDVDDKADSGKKDKSAAVPPFNVHASGSSSSSSRSGGGSSDDIHFDDKKKKDDDDLYEYDNEQYYEEDYNFEEDESDDIVVDDGVAGVPVAPASDQDQAEGSTGFRLSYIYVMLASAVVSFALVLLFFLLCRRSSLERERKLKSAPFVVSDPRTGYRHQQPPPRQSPIVKSYQRVPTSTKEFMVAEQHKQHTSVDMRSKQPLLT